MASRREGDLCSPEDTSFGKDWEVKYYKGVKSGLEKQGCARSLLMVYCAANKVLSEEEELHLKSFMWRER